MRAMVVLPTPLVPVKSQAWCRRPWSRAWVKALTTWSWPRSSGKDLGRHERGTKQPNPSTASAGGLARPPYFVLFCKFLIVIAKIWSERNVDAVKLQAAPSCIGDKKTSRSVSAARQKIRRTTRCELPLPRYNRDCDKLRTHCLDDKKIHFSTMFAGHEDALL
jgi:hypothetical protein